MIDNGNVINKIERYRHFVTRSVSGNIKDGIIDCYSVSDLLPNDLIVIYSDGVSDILNSYQINTVFNSSTIVQEGINQIEALCEIEAKDNFSMIMVQV